MYYVIPYIVKINNNKYITSVTAYRQYQIKYNIYLFLINYSTSYYMSTLISLTLAIYKSLQQQKKLENIGINT